MRGQSYFGGRGQFCLGARGQRPPDFPDTDDLSREVYNGIIVEAERFCHDLTLRYGVLSYECQNEDEYIFKSEQLTREIMSLDDIDLEDLFFGNLLERKKLEHALSKILHNIEEIKKIPLEEQTVDLY